MDMTYYLNKYLNQLTRGVSLFVASAALVGFSSAAVAINKCKDSAGEISYSDSPCLDGVNAQTLQIDTKNAEFEKNNSQKSTQKSHPGGQNDALPATKRFSYDKLRASLPSEKRPQLDKAISDVLAVIMYENIDKPISDSRYDMLADKLQGKTADEVMEMADSLRKTKDLEMMRRAISERMKEYHESGFR